MAAIADALRIANGFLPVSVEFPTPVPTRLLVPDDLSLSLIIFLPNGWLFADPLAPFWPDDPLLALEEDEMVLFYELPDIADGPFILISGYNNASNLNCSILYSVSRIFSFGYNGSL